MIKWFQRFIEKPLEENTFDQTVMHNLPVMEEESDPEDLTLENAYRTRWIWYHTILAILIFFTNMLLFGIFILLAVKL